MSTFKKSRPVGINHVSLEVGNIAEALEFYGSFLDIEYCFEEEMGIPKDEMASIEMGDQFIALTRSNTIVKDRDRHIGLVVEDKEAVRQALTELGIPLLPLPTLTFLDPWGNRIEIVCYRNVMFTKSEAILESMGIQDLQKFDRTLDRMSKKGMIH